MSARVLVVDDILPNVKLLEAKLAAEYYDVVTALSGEEALEKVANDGPDIILLDIMMPGMDGFEVCRRIKADPKIAHIPVVMVTALTDATDRVKGLEAGADDFLSKPVNDTALMSRVRSLVRLKMAVDEWKVRENTANTLGVSNENQSAMEEKVEEASILIVEDQSFEADKFIETLARDRHNTKAVENGLLAMEQSAANDFDLIIISMNMTEEDGLRLVSHLRSNEKTRSVPILMVGNEEDIPKIARGLEIGAHDYIVRPVDRNELLARVRTQIRRKRFQERLRANYEVNLSMAVQDSLTGLYNRRYFMVHMDKLIEKNADSKKALGLLMLDIDHFKSVNDDHGHSVGDDVLKEFASRLEDSVRSFDLVARLGGEEFVVVLPDVTENRAMMIAERLRHSIADKPFVVADGEKTLSITTSVGGALINSSGSDINPDDVLARADKMLYAAKEDSRNCVFFEEKGKLNPDDFVAPDREKVE